ncbi:MAG: DUF4397 domain-containing protein [Chloroflexi bacterium]|nr:DUF4397 domain-containing protein [Chloroflexota bacterium]
MMHFHAPGMAMSRALILFALALVFAVSPLSVAPTMAQGTPAEAAATLRFVHGSPGAPDVDVLLDGLPILEGLPFGTVTEYVTLSPGEHRLQIVSEDQPPAAALVDETLDVAPGAAYILALYGRLNAIEGEIFPLDLSEIEPGEARVRLINLATDTGDIDLLETGGDEWFGDIGLGEASDYRSLPQGTYTADLRGGNDRVLQTLSGLSFQDTRVYNLIALGQIYDDTLTMKALVTRVTPPCARVLEIAGSGGDACLRFVHASPDAPPVDVYLNDAIISQNLGFGTATTYVAVPSGEGRDVRVVATGSPVEGAVIDTPLDFEPGQAYEMLIAGTGEDLDLTVTGTDLRPVPEGQARLRVIHASPDLGGVDIGLPPVETLFEGINFGEATNYVVIDAGTYPIEIRPTGEDLMVALRTDASIEEGMSYDLVVLGRPANRSLRFLALRAPLAIRTGDIATIDVVTDGAAMSETVVPRTIETEVTPTPVGTGPGRIATPEVVTDDAAVTIENEASLTPTG